ncbi:hypothetical protein ACRAWG_19255 [Methylobacterium sp. P31]
MRASSLISAATLMSLASFPSLGQAVDQTGTGGGPTSTQKAPYTTTTGQTVPNPRAINPNETGSIERRSRNEERNDAITRGICIGCSR